MTAATLTLTDFLLARIAEDEAAAVAALGPAAYPSSTTAAEEVLWMGRNEGVADAGLEHFSRHDPVRVLAECEAKRVAVDWYLNDDDTVMGPTVRALAAVYADHPDYRDEWRRRW